jgi:uncharacterized membrane protein
MLEFARWLEFTPLFTAFRGSWYVYPIVMSTHLAAIACFGGMILMTDMRLLGLAMGGCSVSAVVDRLRTPKRCGLIIMIGLGFLLFGCKAEEYYDNAWFRIKVTLLVLIGLHSLIFRGGVYNNTHELDRQASLPLQAKLAGLSSLILWTLVVCAGRGIGYLHR